ncbi:carboxypeptidase-like regulatory domain-containing protein [Treponema primitia]|uniref:carboxypeptidase-like regulatory domain-containing protein n=1 Tax=Treponema primitia TaxID=88058 RepID=UPI00025555C5|nr:carboxypeptidase-like regulatory domain-containing protein [Treponema primitia]
MKNYLICLSIIMAVFFSCATSPIQKRTAAGLYGMIYDGDNKPVKEVKIYAGDKFSAISDINGHFSLPGLKPGKEYRIKACKENYEAVELEIDYLDPQNVLYINIYHVDQLLNLAEQALRDKDWLQTESLLSRTEYAHGDYPSIQYLRGIMAFHRGEYDNALGILIKLTEQEKAPYLYLFIADLYQYYTGDKDRAVLFLNKFLELRYDTELDNRIRELTGSGT